MGEITKFPRKPKKDLADLKNDSEFVADLAHYAEGIISEADVKKKYRFDDTTWERLGRDEELVESIQDERVRRVRSGACKREKAQRYVVRAPDVMNDIMTDENMPARQRIESAKTLRAEILVEYGWLTAIKMRRYDAHKWQIIRKAELFSKVSHVSRDSGLPYAQ